MSEPLSPGSRRIQELLAARGSAAVVLELPGSTRTAADAAAALGCEVGAIANSLVFMGDEQLLLVLTSGAHRVDTAALAERLGLERIRRASPAEVKAATGQSIGGVSPLGHPAPVRTVVDEDLAGFETVWAAAGTAHSVFNTSYPELLELTGGTPAKVD